jgi:hypothetical protein
MCSYNSYVIKIKIFLCEIIEKKQQICQNGYILLIVSYCLILNQVVAT